MNKHKGTFYAHLVNIEEVLVELDTLDLSHHEKHHLGQLMDSNVHHSVLDVILQELQDEDKEILLRLINSDKHDKIWEHLNAKVDAVEEKIQKAAQEITRQMHMDIKEAKRLKGKVK
jgi:hypothetical protein